MHESAGSSHIQLRIFKRQVRQLVQGTRLVREPDELARRLQVQQKDEAVRAYDSWVRVGKEHVEVHECAPRIIVGVHRHIHPIRVTVGIHSGRGRSNFFSNTKQTKLVL